MIGRRRKELRELRQFRHDMDRLALHVERNGQQLIVWSLSTMPAMLVLAPDAEGGNELTFIGGEPRPGHLVPVEPDYSGALVVKLVRHG